ncbi:hypothetical protein ACHAWF_013167 [Thalassiosira exigua]
MSLQEPRDLRRVHRALHARVLQLPGLDARERLLPPQRRGLLEREFWTRSRAIVGGGGRSKFLARFGPGDDDVVLGLREIAPEPVVASFGRSTSDVGSVASARSRTCRRRSSAGPNVVEKKGSPPRCCGVSRRRFAPLALTVRPTTLAPRTHARPAHQCVMLKETANDEQPLYAKIGCQHRDTYTSTRLQLHVYKDAQCSQAYGGDGDDDEDGDGEDQGNGDGYDLDGYFISNKVSFRPPFYSCQSCIPEQVSNTFSKQYSAWYDDDYISTNGQRQKYNADDDANANAQDDQAAANADDANANADDADANDDDGAYYQQNDDYGNSGYDDANYAAAADDAYNNAYNNDDAAAANDDAADQNNVYVNYDDHVYYNYQSHDDDFYALDDDNARRGLRRLERRGEIDAGHSLSAKDAKEAYEADFEQEMSLIRRRLEDADEANYNNIATWNMCQRVHKYGMWCDTGCQALDTFRVDEWSRSDIFLLVIMCIFMGAMMLLVFAKRVKAYERAAMWGDEPGAPNPGLPPCAMLMLFGIVFMIIVVLAALKFVNETLVFAVVTCVLLFIYMLKLTLFESRKQVFLPGRSSRNAALKEPFY